MEDKSETPNQLGFCVIKFKKKKFTMLPKGENIQEIINPPIFLAIESNTEIPNLKLGDFEYEIIGNIIQNNSGKFLDIVRGWGIFMLS